MVGLLLGAFALPAAATPVDPVQWPEGSGTDPELTTTAHTARFSGADRYQTNQALALGLRGKGDYPYDTSDRTGGNAPSLAATSDWWGAASCPRSVVVVAGDTFVDALAAASLSDPVDLGDQPRLERVAAADPEFDPPGELDRVETAHAPIIVTHSARSGASALAASARMSVMDLARGGCSLVREAILVGGSRAIPTGVEAELVGLGVEEVFRVAGGDRYETAALVARALGTESVAAGATCADPDATDGATRLGFYGNAVVEYRSGPTSCRLLSRSVVLAEGGTGADALAAGWWTSRWQVPVLLTAPDGTLPPATRAALAELDIDSVIVLGGLARIPESTVDEARVLASAVAGRISGGDRYETSVEMARAFGGWFPDGDGASFAGDLVCLAASGGSGPASRGWPDALAAGPWCARVAAAGGGSPDRALAPLLGSEQSAVRASTGGTRPSHDAVPILLVEPAAPALPQAVRTLLREAFLPSTAWCTGRNRAQPCLTPGFGTVFGGATQVSSGAVDDLEDLVSGGTSSREDRAPTITDAFVTGLDLSYVYATAGTGDRGACVPGGGLVGVRWLSLYETGDRKRFVGETDLLALPSYDQSGVGRPICTRLASRPTVAVDGISLSGNVAPGPVVDASVPAVAAGVLAQSAPPATLDRTSRWYFTGPVDQPATLRTAGGAEAVRSATLDLEWRVVPGAPDRRFVIGAASIASEGTVLELSFTGDARQTADGWEIAGRAASSTDGESAVGGLRARITGSSDLQAFWQVDGFDELLVRPISSGSRQVLDPQRHRT